MDLSTARWRKSSFSGDNGGDRVEVAEVDGGPDHKSGRLIAVRDSKDPDGPVLFFTPEEWKAFVLGVQAGEFEPAP